MDVSDLAALDLNLLVSFQALFQECHVTRAASRLGVSQPAMSRALARLREMFDDPLFVRGKSGMDPTARARELYPHVERTLLAIKALVQPVDFDPQSAKGRVRVAAPDIVVYMLVPELMRRLARDAPHLDLELVKWQPNWKQCLQDGLVDLTVGFPMGDEPNLYARQLIESHWMTVVREGHPTLRKKWTLENFCQLDHILVSLTGQGGGPVDAALARKGLTRRIALRVPYPALTPLLVAETDLVLTTIAWLAHKLAKTVGLVVRRPPIKLPSLRAPMVWHERNHRDPKQKWLRGLVADIARNTPQS